MAKESTVKVWDPLVRIFHWSLVLSFFTAYASGDELEDLHVYAGYVVLGLVAFRLVWGVIGTRHARFSDFAYPPTRVVEYLRSLLTRHPRHYLGHNPAGGWMVIALLFMLVLTSLSGLQLYGLQGGGPLAGPAPVLIESARASGRDDDRGRDRDEHRAEAYEEFWEETHEVLSNLTLALVAFHIAGVVVSSRLHRENLVKAMITGRKPRTGQAP